MCVADPARRNASIALPLYYRQFGESVSPVDNTGILWRATIVLCSVGSPVILKVPKLYAYKKVVPTEENRTMHNK